MGETTQARRTIVICQMCRKRVCMQRNGEWYHRHNASAFCRPGVGNGQKAVPFRFEPRA